MCFPAPHCRQAKPHSGADVLPQLALELGHTRAGWVTITVEPVPALYFPPQPLLAASHFHSP